MKRIVEVCMVVSVLVFSGCEKESKSNVTNEIMQFAEEAESKYSSIEAFTPTDDISGNTGSAYRVTCKRGDMEILRWNNKWYGAARLSWTDKTKAFKKKFDSYSKEEIASKLCYALDSSKSYVNIPELDAMYEK